MKTRDPRAEKTGKPKTRKKAFKPPGRAHKPGPSPDLAPSQVRVDGGCSEAEKAALEVELDISPRKFEYRDVKYRERPFDRAHLWGWPFAELTAWNSVLLFFNLAADVAKPGDYQPTMPQDALNFLDLGVQPADVPITDFIFNYWKTLSYGNLRFGIETPRGANGQPIVPEISPANGSGAWQQCINLCLDANAQEIWEASGGHTRDGKRWIPSVVLVERFNNGISAGFGPIEVSVGGEDYLVGDRHHMHYNLAWASPDGPGTSATGRMIWGRMCHEYAHNFLEFGDLYTGAGCTGYWDLLGDSSPSTRMSEVCSHIKERTGWLNYERTIEGPAFPRASLSLRPYTTTGEAIKVVPAPEKNPQEFFLLEYRKSTGDEIWRPDGGLTEEGLLITHISNRMLNNARNRQPRHELLREAPFFDPEFADYSDNGGTLWTGHGRTDGVLYPQPANDRFTPDSSPNSGFYGYVPSGLSITNIRIDGGELKFDLEIDGNVRSGSAVHGGERAQSGRFYDDPKGGTEQVFFRDAECVALLAHRQCQWVIERKQTDWIGEWNLGPDNYEVTGDLDGDGFDEVYVRSPEWAGVLKWQYGRFQSITVQHDWVMGWNLGPHDRELAADVDGDGADEIFIRSHNWGGIIKLINGQLKLQSIQYDWVDQWNLGAEDHHYSGRFTQSGRDEILIRSGEWMGLLKWDAGAQKLRLKSIQHAWIDQWNIGPSDRHYIGDFDGDGLDEIYIRSDRWAGVMKWDDDRFKLLWLRHLTLNAWDGNAQSAVDLTGQDRSYSGRFRHDRDGILHRYDGGIAVLHWLDGEMKVRHKYRSPFEGKWNLAPGDKFVLGQFVRGGFDVGDPTRVIIQPGLTGLLIHNAWGIGSVAVNSRPISESEIREVIGLDFIRKSDLLYSG